jgi:hypothetical protein
MKGAKRWNHHKLVFGIIEFWRHPTDLVLRALPKLSGWRDRLKRYWILRWHWTAIR